MAQTIKNMLAIWENQVCSLGQEDLMEREWQPAPVSLSGEFHGQSRPEGYSPWGLKESNMTERPTHIR